MKPILTGGGDDGFPQQAIQVIVDQGGGSNWEWIVTGVVVPIVIVLLGYWFRRHRKKNTRT